MADDPGNAPARHADIRPGYMECLSNAASQFQAFWQNLLVIAAVMLVVTMLISLIQLRLEPWQYLLFSFPLSIISLVLSYGYILATIKAARGEKPSVRDLYRPFRQVITIVFASILLGLIIGVGLLMLIVPGIILLVRLSFVPYLVVDQKAGVVEAIQGSWNITRGHFGSIFLLGLTYIVAGMVIAGITLTVVTAGVDLSGFMDYMVNPTPNLAAEFTLGVLFMPVGVYLLLVWGSLYQAIRS